jgi:aldehyde:ferredoxin oxidoreductase
LWDGLGKLLESATGLDFDGTSLQEIADRIYCLEMAFNARQGVRRKDDRLPQRPEVQGTSEGQEEVRKHEEMLSEYYEMHGCDIETGIPTRKRLESLGLKEVADELEILDRQGNWDGPPLWPLNDYNHGGFRV